MLVQIYETSSAEEARALADIGVDHIGVLVGSTGRSLKAYAFPSSSRADWDPIMLLLPYAP